MGLVFLWGGAAIAIGIGGSTLDIQIDPDSPICSEIEKNSEWGADCFCVEGNLSNLQELDCLVESGVVPAHEYEAYKESLLPPKEIPTHSRTPQCLEIGKSSELGGDCYCVEGSVSDMQEVDCLIASGVVPADSYDGYRRMLGLISSENQVEGDTELNQDSIPDLQPNSNDG